MALTSDLILILQKLVKHMQKQIIISEWWNYVLLPNFLAFLK